MRAAADSLSICDGGTRITLPSGVGNASPSGSDVKPCRRCLLHVLTPERAKLILCGSEELLSMTAAMIGAESSAKSAFQNRGHLNAFVMQLKRMRAQPRCKKRI
jgi:hypothetical protein